MSSALNAARRARELAEAAAGSPVDVLIIGGGVTGTGAALDAASRGLRTVLLERHDLAFGTSRWSSKLVHGGLRYLASGQVGIAHESARERAILLRTVAPHLIRPLPQLIPLTAHASWRAAALMRAGLVAGDLLRRSAGTTADELPQSRHASRAEALRLAPTLRQGGLRGGLLAWDGQLVDDARLVVAIARTAAAHGAKILTRAEATGVTGDGATVRDTLTGESFTISARAVINATGVWAGEVDPSLTLRPSRGTHLVFNANAFGGLSAALTVPVNGSTSRYVFAFPAAHQRVYLGLTDEDAPGPIPDVAKPTAQEAEFLLSTINTVLREPLTSSDVIGSFAGLRPLLDSGSGATADISRQHAVTTSPSGLITVVGGKLTTYRKMAEDAVTTAIRARGLRSGPAVTDQIPLVGAVSPPERDRLRAPAGLIAKYGAEAAAVAAAGPLTPISAGSDVTAAELAFAVSHEGALTVADLLDRRTRLGLVETDRTAAEPAAQAALASTRQ